MSRPFGDSTLGPVIDDLNRVWFTSGVITIQICGTCGTMQHPPDELCHACQGSDLQWRECEGQGKIESKAVIHQSVFPGWEDALPYTVVVVSLDDAQGINVIGNIVNRPPEEVSIGQSVRAVFEELAAPPGGRAEGEAPILIPQWEVM